MEVEIRNVTLDDWRANLLGLLTLRAYAQALAEAMPAGDWVDIVGSDCDARGCDLGSWRTGFLTKFHRRPMTYDEYRKWGPGPGVQPSAWLSWTYYQIDQQPESQHAR